MRDFFFGLEPQKLLPVHDLQGFNCGNEDMTDFLVSDALRYQEMRVSTTYVFVRKGTVAPLAYVTLCCDSLRLTEDEKEEEDIICGYPIPAVKIARLGVHLEMQRRGLGAAVLEYAIGLAAVVSEYVGCRFVTVDALPKKEDWYISRRFRENEVHSRRNRDVTKTTSLRFDLLDLDTYL